MLLPEGEFFSGLAEVAGTLLGTFLVGLFFYLDLDAHRGRRVADDRYLRAGVRSVFILYAIPLFVPITFIALEPVWGRMLFATLSVLLVAATVSTGRRILTPRGSAQSPTVIINEWAGMIGTIPLVALPWVLGGLAPRPADFNASLLLALGFGFSSTVTLIMNEFDAKRDARPRTEPGSSAAGIDSA